MRPTWVEIDLDAVARNFRRLRELVAPRRMWCVLKADAYGHGAVAIGRRLEAEGAEALAVATVDEGIELRDAGIATDILVMAGIEPLPSAGASDRATEVATAVVEHRLDVAVWSTAATDALAAAVRAAAAEPTRVHLKVDTGMGRLGVLVDDDFGPAVELAAAISATEGVELAAVFSNLAAGDAAPDDPRAPHNQVQTERFAGVCAALDDAGLLPPRRHLANSAAILQHPATWEADWSTDVRPGIALLGVRAFPNDETYGFEPVMTWQSAVAAIRDLRRGWPIGYGGHRRAERDCRVAVVPVGYHDGFPRALSDRAEVLVGGRRAPVVGLISMDLTLVDISLIPDVGVGTPVVLLGAAGDDGETPVSAEELAFKADSMTHELLCRIGRRVPRRYVGRGS